MYRYAAALCVIACSARDPGEPKPFPHGPAPEPDPRIDQQAQRIAALEGTVAKLETTVTKLATALDKQLGPAATDEATVYAVPIDPRDPIDGPIDARVTIIAVYELMDPTTLRLEPLLAAQRAKHPADVRIIWRYLPVHGGPALPAGIVECAAAKAGAWQSVHGKLLVTLFDHERPLPEKSGLEQLRPIAASAGLPGDKLDAEIAPCKLWLDVAAKSLAPFGITAPPAVIVNGRVLAGLPDPARLDAVVAEELAKAASSGIPGAGYYQHAVVETGAKSVKGRFE